MLEISALSAAAKILFQCGTQDGRSVKNSKYIITVIVGYLFMDITVPHKFVTCFGITCHPQANILLQNNTTQRNVELF
jgi:hypothetical protein